MKLIVGLTGEKAGGKGTIAAYLKERYGATAYRFSDPLTATLKLLNLPVTRQNQIGLSIILRREFGEDVLAKALTKMAAENPSELVVVDGIRRMADIAALKTLPRFHYWYVTADVRTRFERSRARGEKEGDRDMPFEKFAAEEQAETEVSIKETAAGACDRIDNDGTIDELHAKVDGLMKELWKSK